MSANMNKANKPSSSYLKSVRSEMRKVSWPTKKEVFNYTGVVLIMCAIAAIVIGIMDFGFNIGFDALRQLVGNLMK